MRRTLPPIVIALGLTLLTGTGCGTSAPAGSGTGSEPGASNTAAPGGGTGGAPPTATPAVYRTGSTRVHVSGNVNASYDLTGLDAPHALTVPTPSGSGVVWEDAAGDQLQISWASDVPASGVTHSRTLIVFLTMLPGNELVQATSVHGECRVSVRHADASGFSGSLSCSRLRTDFGSTIRVRATYSVSA